MLCVMLMYMKDELCILHVGFCDVCNWQVAQSVGIV